MDDWKIELGNDYWYNSRPISNSISKIGIQKVEQLRNCTYVCEWILINSRGDFTHPVLLFWNDEPHPQGSNWMALYVAYPPGSDQGEWRVSDGISATQVPLPAIISDDKEAVVSLYRHHHNTSRDGSVFIDGGTDYIRSSVVSSDRWKYLVPLNGKLEIIDEVHAKLLRPNV